MNQLKVVAVLLVMGLTMFFETAQAGPTLEAVKKNGVIKCGVSQGVPGFSNRDEKGNWSGIDVDFCRALSTAIFGNTDKVKYIPLPGDTRFTALSSGEVDLLYRGWFWHYYPPD
jgi:general L-amino acid transport system substrate-binding protein